MFQVEREQRLGEMDWVEGVEGGLYVIEGWKYDSLHMCTRNNYRSGHLKQSDLATWLEQKVSILLPRRKKR